MKKTIKKLLSLILIIFLKSYSFAQETINMQDNKLITPVLISLKEIIKYDSLHPNLQRIKTNTDNKNPSAKKERLKITPRNLETKPIGEVNLVNPNVINTKNRNVSENSPCENFTALNDICCSIPPDVNGVVGFNHIMTTLNTEVKIQDKKGNQLFKSSLNAWWQAALPAVNATFDPKITYDPFNHRYIFVCCNGSVVTNTSLLIAISQTSDPTGSWWFYQIDPDSDNNEWFDYPSLGFNKKWVSVSGNMFNSNDNNTQSRIFTFRKTELYNGSSLTYNTWNNSEYATICPAITYDNTSEELWFVTNDDVDDNDLRLFKISGQVNTPSFTEETWYTVSPINWHKDGVSAPQLGGNGIHAGDHRIKSVFFRNGSLWSAQNIFIPASGPTTVGVQIVQLDPYSESHIYTNIFLDNSGAQMFAYPSIAINADGDLFIGYSSFSTTGYASARISYRRNGQSTFNTFEIGAGLANYYKTNGGDKNRWGDYTSTCIDPEDDKAVWTIQEYARTGNTWGTNWAKICPINCTTNIAINGNFPNGTLRKWEATSTITSTATNTTATQIKYDAGIKITLSPGFRANNGSYFKAYIDGCGGVK